MLGGKLGRHPRLALEFDHIFTENEILEYLERCLRYYKKNSLNGDRFANLFNELTDIL